MHLVYLAFSEVGKMRNTKEYWRRTKNHFQLCLIVLQISSIIIYIIREVKYEQASAALTANRDGSMLYYVNQLSHIFLVIQGHCYIF